MPLLASAADANLELKVLSAYVSDGQVGNDEAVFQPSLDVAGPFGFGFNLWANMDLTDSARSKLSRYGSLIEIIDRDHNREP